MPMAASMIDTALGETQAFMEELKGRVDALEAQGVFPTWE